jgi:hypothetical protein
MPLSQDTLRLFRLRECWDYDSNKVFFLENLIMATSIRGRSGASGRTTTGRNSSSYTTTTTTKIPAAWKTCNNLFSNKVNSFKTLIGQTKGPAKCSRPTPATLNTFANWINKGAIIQTCTTGQINKWAKSSKKTINTKTINTTTCKNILGAKFGKSSIKAVARTKSGSFMVVTAPVVGGKKFCFPK